MTLTEAIDAARDKALIKNPISEWAMGQNAGVESMHRELLATLPDKSRTEEKYRGELGAKHDQGKLLFGCFTKGLAPVIKGVVAVLSYGAQKYERNSWQHVPNGRERYKDALDRHLNAIDMGETHDEESGLPHIFHAVCNLMFVAWFDYSRSPPDYLGHDPYKFKKPPSAK